MKKALLVLILVLFTLPTILAQNIKFGKVSKAELEEKYHPLDSSANAAILYKKRRTYYEYIQGDGFILITEIHERIKLYNKDGFDWATKSISIYNNGGRDESVSGLKASTYSLENNKIQETKLKKDGIFKENTNKYWDKKKFTLPNLKEGCIVEWKYKINSPFAWNISDAVFQYTIPAKYIEIKVETPEYYVFKNQMQGFYPIKLEKTTKQSSITLNSKTRESGDYFGSITKTNYEQQKIDLITNIINCRSNNIPALKKEPYVNNLDNYRTILKFEHTATKFPNTTPKFYNSNWNDVTKTIYNSSNFGGQLEKSSYFKDDLENLVSEAASVDEKITKIFQFVKNKIKWDEFNSKYTSKGVKKAYKEGTGNVAEINLILVSMLREVGVNANPVLVSTRSHGISLFPTTDGFNYVIAGVELNNDVILLDATEKYSLPNVLPLRDLNWQGRIVRKNGSSTSISLFPKQPTKETAFLNVEIDSEGSLKGMERSVYKNLQAVQYRTRYNNIAEDDLITKFEKNNDDIEIDEFKMVNKNKIAKPLIYQFNFETDNQVEVIGDKMYFSPLLFLATKENPFKLENREYPVDYGSPWVDKYTISIQFPEGYTIESKPENVAYALPENLGSYKFVAVLKEDKLQVLSEAKINFPIITPTHYKALKEFYKKMIDKQLEKVVLIKK